ALVACAWQSAAYAVGAAMLAVPDEIARKGAEALDESARREAESHARHGSVLLGEAGWSSETAALAAARNAAGAILRVAEDHDAAVVVSGTRGRSPLAAALLGSTAEGIARHAGRPVLLVPPPDDE
ncbi:MAG TPA: universal stress protein, partial [Solirubrobacteraceae bacterium]|nr:universal stress protein [Solirubrobacteraceae bacterium]